MRSTTADLAGIRALLGQVETLAASRLRRHLRLLIELMPRLQAARRIERQLDRHLARRFNAFKYLRTDELGLSSIIADLLNPSAEHGQGALFLQAMLDQLPQRCVLPSQIEDSPQNTPVKVETERGTRAGRRIDITVEILDGNAPYCLAFENKPYAEDQPCQIRDYLNFLNRQYRGRFLLVYLPPVDRMPGEIALSAEDRKKWCANFWVMPYSGASNSLESWVGECRRRCEVERLNWFLQQFHTFCRQRFGESTMTSDAETREIRAYLQENPNQMQSALAIHDAWQVIRSEICKRFLEHLRDKLESRLECKGQGFECGLRVRCVYGGDKRGANALWVTRDDWPPYEIKLQCGFSGPRSWYWGVRCLPTVGQMTESQQQIRNDLKAALDKSGIRATQDDNGEWPNYEWLGIHNDWHQLAPSLFTEIETGVGEATDHYLEGLFEIAVCAIPVLDEFAKTASEHRTE